MTQGAKANSMRPRLDLTMQAHGVDLKVPVCVFCGCNDLRVGGREVETFLSCPRCGADGPIGRGLFLAVDKYRVNTKEGQADG